jgi:hypothetical protein
VNINVIGLALSLVCLFIGTCALAVVNALFEGKTEGGNLHVGTAILVSIIGGVLFLFWGWTSTLVLMGFLTVWTVVGGLAERKRRMGDSEE